MAGMFIDVAGRSGGRERRGAGEEAGRGVSGQHLHAGRERHARRSSRRTSTSARCATSASRRRPRARCRSSSSTSASAPSRFVLAAVLAAACALHGPRPPTGDLVDLAAVDPTIRIDIRYATTGNFTGVAVYPVARCLLRRDAAERLARVQRRLRADGLGLLVWDCYRPFAVQERFWALVPDERYVARPERRDGRPVAGSKHNRGAAVDVDAGRRRRRGARDADGLRRFQRAGASRRARRAPGGARERRAARGGHGVRGLRARCRPSGGTSMRRAGATDELLDVPPCTLTVHAGCTRLPAPTT